LLLIDNAHGAYLEFLQNSMHPIKLGADICCDSAHKTLPVLTGGAYLHTKVFSDKAKSALALFGSTSPSYLILQSLDAANKYISDGYKEKLTDFVKTVDTLKETLVENGYVLCGNEPLKITIKAKEYGYSFNETGVFEHTDLVSSEILNVSDFSKYYSILYNENKKAQ
jgi:arginine/lysine/ornithine decarboxylase